MSKYDVILDVYEIRHLKAAQKHNYTQSAVSQTIPNYEKEIGLKLFKRSNGMEALPGTEPIFEELMHIRSANTDRSDRLKYQQSGQWFLSASERCRALPITGSPEY